MPMTEFCCRTLRRLAAVRNCGNVAVRQDQQRDEDDDDPVATKIVHRPRDRAESVTLAAVALIRCRPGLARPPVAPVIMADDLLGRGAGQPAIPDHPSSSQHPDAVDQAEDLLQIVADDQHREAPVAQSGDDLFDGARLGRTERGRRLVHDDDLRSPGGRASDGDGLALTAGQVRGRRVDGRHGAAEAGEHRLRLGRHASLVENIERPGATQQLAAEVDVGPDRHIAGQRQVLIDRLDTSRSRFGRGGEMRPVRRRARPCRYPGSGRR